MTRAIAIYAIFVLAPSVLLSFLALRVVDKDARERAAALAAPLEEEAASHAARVEEAIGEAFARWESGEGKERGSAAVWQDGAWQREAGVSPVGEAPPAEAEPVEGKPPPDETRLYGLALRGGESFEFEVRDRARAVDAYAFYLPRIRDRALRSRLRFRMARALGGADALADGAAHERSLAGRILRALFEDARGVLTEEGFPVDLLSASLLLSIDGSLPPELLSQVGERLLGESRTISTPMLSRLAEVLAPEAEAIHRIVARRRALEDAVAAHPEIIGSAEAALGDGYLLLAKALAEPGAREVRLVRFSLPPPSEKALAVSLEPVRAESRAEHGVAFHPVRLPGGGPIACLLRLEDPEFSLKLAALGRTQRFLRASVLLLLCFTLAGGFFLVRYLYKERRLASLRTKLIANVSHELKTPVTSIRLFSEMLAGDPVSQSQARRFTEMLRSESFKLSRLVEDLLDLSRLGRKEAELRFQPTDVAALLRSLAEAFAFRAREEGVEFLTEGLDAPGAVLSTDAGAVERIVSNLLDNAVKYRRAEGARALLRLSEEPGRACISVEDNGPGIPKGDRERIFEEFYRVRYEDYAVKGSGLGLSIARRLAGKLGGEIRLESREGEGSTFTLILPRKEAS